MVGRSALIFAAFVIETLSVSAGPAPKAPPKFADYPAQDSFAGQSAPTKIVTPSQRQYRTQIQQGVEKAWGVLEDGVEQNKPGANFAGDMIVIQWSCGAPCLRTALVNARTGDVFNPPLAVDDTLALPLLRIGGDSPGSNPELTFRKDSRLMIMSATPDWLKQHARSYRHYFVWEANRLILVYRALLG